MAFSVECLNINTNSDNIKWFYETTTYLCIYCGEILVTCPIKMGVAMKNDKIHETMITIRACAPVQRDLALSGNMIAINLQENKNQIIH